MREDDSELQLIQAAELLENNPRDLRARVQCLALTEPKAGAGYGAARIDSVIECLTLLDEALPAMTLAQVLAEGGPVLELAVKAWKHFGDDVSECSSMNYSSARRLFLTRLSSTIKGALAVHPHGRLEFYAALMAEYSGERESSLGGLSDLITAQAQGCGVSLSLLILRSAAILLLMKRLAEAIEYLEYLNDDEIFSNHDLKLLSTALLLIAYEKSNDYQALVASASDKLLLQSSNLTKKSTTKRSVTQIFRDLADCVLFFPDSPLFAEPTWGILLLTVIIDRKPLHVDSLVQLASLLSMTGSQSAAQDLAERALAVNVI